jgi:glyoxylase-like metal-dependent hydrolase (beta-lactamase superfamily II)
MLRLMRGFACAGALLVAGAAWGQAAPIPPGYQERATTDLGAGVYTFGSFAARSLFVVTDAGVIATDPVSPEFASAFRAAIRQVTPKPVKYVVYSHQHWDHVRGGRIFKDEGATFVAHEKCLAHFKAHPNPDIVMPDRTVKGDDDIRLGGRHLRLFYYGPNHGDCMLVMQADGSDVLYVNDLVTPFSVGLGFMPDYDPGGWVDTLRRLEARTDWTRLVGGHGIPVAPRAALTERRRFMEALMAAVKQGVDAGKSADQIAATIDLPEFKAVRGYDAQIGRAAERIYHYYTMGW